MALVDELTSDLRDILDDAAAQSCSSFGVFDALIGNCGRLLAIHGPDNAAALITAAERAIGSKQYPLRLPNHRDVSLERLDWTLFRQFERQINALAANMRIAK